MLADRTHTQHCHIMDNLGFAFCFEAHNLYYDDVKELPQIAQLLGQTVQDVQEGIDAYKEYILS